MAALCRRRSDLDAFDARLRGQATSAALPLFPGLEREGDAGADSSDDEPAELPEDGDEGAASAGGSPGSAREGSGGEAGRVVASRPPSLSREVSLASVPAQYKHLHRLHSAAVSMQKVARGGLTRRD